jgi:CheY-like chemotaxis protein
MMPSDFTILLVEDSPDDVLLIQRAFRKANLLNPVAVVSDGEKAIEYLSGTGAYSDRAKFQLPVLILLDLKLPRKSGHEVLGWVKQHPSLRRLPVVVLTSSTETVDVNKAYDLGANSYLVKPVGFDDLFAMVKTLQPYWLIMNEKPDVATG